MTEKNPESPKPKSLNPFLWAVVILLVSLYLVQLNVNQKLTAEIATTKNNLQQVIDAQNSATPTAKVDLAAVTSKDHRLGSPDAKITMLVYSDLECPFCKQFHQTMRQIETNYQGQVAWVYRHYPLDKHVNAEKEGEATECAASLGGESAFWQYANDIMDRTTSNGTGFALSALTPLAGEIGLDTAKFDTCLNSGQFESKVKSDLDSGVKANINATPTSFILDKNGKILDTVPGALPYDQIKSALDQYLNNNS